MQSCVVVVDSARARFFTIRRRGSLDRGRSHELHETKSLFNPESELSGSELYENLKTGRNRDASNTPAHGYDDHRDRHEQEFSRRFAHDIVAEIDKLARSEGVDNCVLVAPPKMLGTLRKESKSLVKHGLEIHDYGKDFTQETADSILERLQKAGIGPLANLS